MFKKLSVAAVSSVLIALGVGEAVQASTFTSSVVASGLDNPRGLAFDSDGSLYVTEAGKGGTGACVPSPSVQGANICFGATGAVTRIQNGEQKRVITGLPSLALPDGGEANGPNDIAFDSNNKPYIVVGLATEAPNRDAILKIPDFGRLATLDFQNNSWQNLADLSGFELANNFDQDSLVTNPYSLLIQNDTAFVVDSGANDLLRVGLDGSNLALQSVFGTRLVTNPLSGTEIPLQSVPTSITTSPDGGLYVGELTGFPFPEGAARIYELGPDGQPTVFTDGFTQIVDSTFDSEGNLYVLEYAARSLLTGDPTGALIKVASDGTRTKIDSNQLIYPTAIALGDDGAIYVSNKGSIAGQGEVLKFVSQPIPENSSPLLGLIALGGLSILNKQHKRFLQKKVNINPETTLNS